MILLYYNISSISIYGDDRKTDIQLSSADIDILDIIPNEQVVVTISHLGYVKRTTLESYKSQN